MTKEVPLINSEKFALVDDEDYDRVMAGVPCRIDKKGYPHKGGKSLHEFILGTKYIPKNESPKWKFWRMREKYLIDHKNRDKLDCRKENLRYATFSQNNANKPPNGRLGLRGVCLDPKTNLYRAYIHKDGKMTVIGTFSNAEAAGRAYDSWAIRLHGEFAYLNFPDSPLAGECENK